MDERERQSLLVEVQGSSARRLLASRPEIAGVAFDWEEVFRGPLAVAALEDSDETTFLLARPAAAIPGVAAWDLAHRLRRALPADLVAAGAVRSIEPNALPVPAHVALPPGDAGEPPAGDESNCNSDPQDPAWPVGAGVAWHLGPSHSQLAEARKDFQPTPRRVRIGHLDTGYSPGHATRPRYLRHDLGYNFYRESRDTTDNMGGIFQGHGTRTLSVLAGSRVRAPGFDGDLGGAPDAEVVPIVADGSILISVVNQAYWARAFEHAILSQCDVLSVSAGGLWADGGAIERVIQIAEARGIVVAAAAGNHFCGPQDMVWPARFPTVLAVTGAMANQQPYTSCSLRYYSSSYGPREAMATAIAAYTPNVTIARYGCPEVLNHNGDGTSHSTPQVAAAAALWIQKHGAKYPPQRRALACRAALLRSAEKRPEHAWMYGNGILKAKDALAVSLSEAELESLAPAPEPQPVLLEGFGAAAALPELERALLEREMLGLARRNPELWRELQAEAGGEDRRARLTRVFSGERLSGPLRRFLAGE